MLNQYLTMMTTVRGTAPDGFKYPCIEGLVLAEGREFVSAPLTAEQHRYIREVINLAGRRFPWKECFSTSQRIKALYDFDSRLDYYEGYAASFAFPVHHGWLVLDGERVIDLTWRKQGIKPTRLKLEHTRVFGKFPEGWAYRGVVAADRDEIKARAIKYQEWGSFLDDWREGYPRLRAA
jgi:hypothetical protein